MTDIEFIRADEMKENEGYKNGRWFWLKKKRGCHMW
jgi:hypothetical protein